MYLVPSALAADDQLPVYLRKFPTTSTATQKVELLHDTELSGAPPSMFLADDQLDPLYVTARPA
jgi:hypothetical protein